MKKLVVFAILLLVLLSACNSAVNSKVAATVFKSPNCGCCSVYVPYVEGKGFDVAVVMTDDMNAIKLKHNIPRNMESCHTMVVGDYFVEGHVPVEAINKLLSEKPDIDGISLPDMPSGSPGMPGVKRLTWIIYAIKDGVQSEFMRI